MVSVSADTKFGWHRLQVPRWDLESDEEKVSYSVNQLGAQSVPTAGRYNSHDLEVTAGAAGIDPGFYEVKRLHDKDGKYVDRRFKVGQRGELIYGRRDAEIKSFASALENFLDTCNWGREAIEQTHEFIDQAFQRKHGKKFQERLSRLASASASIPALTATAQAAVFGAVGSKEIEAGFSGLKGIFIIADHIYTLVKPNEYVRFIGFDGASAEGPKLTYAGVVPLAKFDTVRRTKGK